MPVRPFVKPTLMYDRVNEFHRSFLNDWSSEARVRFQAPVLGWYAFWMMFLPGFVGAAENEVQIQGSAYTLVADCPDAQYDLVIRLGARSDGSTADTLGVLFGYQDDSNHYLLMGRNGRMRLSVVEKGKRRTLAEGDRWEPRQEALVLVRRREHLLSVSVDDIEVAEVFDASFGSGRVGLLHSGGDPQVIRVQRYGEIVFDDDFMRAETEQNLPPWELVAGEWRFHSVKEKHAGTAATHSTNPFSLGGKAKAEEGKPARVITGQSFWSDYQFDASVKSHQGCGGMAFGYQSEQNYYEVRWDLSSPSRVPSLMRLTRVSGDQREVLAEGYAEGGSEQWYRLGVRLRNRRIQVFLDESLLLDVTENRVVRGRVGLWVEGPNEIVFDDVRVRDNRIYEFDQPEGLKQLAQAVAGHWSFHPLAREGVAGNTETCSLCPSLSGQAAMSFGAPGWKDYLFSFQVLQPRAGSLALFVGEQKLFDLPFGPEPLGVGVWHNIQMDLIEPHQALLYLNGTLHQRLSLPQPLRGAPGLSVKGNLFQKPEIRQVRVAFERLDDLELPTKNPLFVNDPYMRHWSSPEGAWIPTDAGNTTFWHKGDFFGMLALTLPSQDGVRLLFAVDQPLHGQPDSKRSYVLEQSIDANSKKVTLTLHRLGQAVGSKTLPFLDNQTAGKFRLHRDGAFIWIQAGQEDVLEYRDDEPLPGTAMAIVARQPLVAEDFRAMNLARNHIRDETFEHAFADWIRVGTWEVTNRFSCTPTWSHLNGRSTGGSAFLWNKFDYDGDVSIEFYAGIRMRQSVEEMANVLGSYPRNGDFNASFCCDGFDPNTGYSFLLTAWDFHWSEKWSYLLRRGEEMRRTDRYLVPRTREGGSRPSVAWVSEGRPVHGAWYFVKVRRRGPHIEYYYDNQLVPELCWDDPEPLKGRNLALWTLDNSIMIARAKIAYARRSVPSRLLPPPRAPLPRESVPSGLRITSSTNPALNDDFEEDVCGWKSTSADEGASLSLDAGSAGGGQQCLTLTHASLGGDFGALIPIPVLDASRVVDFSFDYCVPHEVRVNFYLNLAGQDYFIEFTGENRSDENLKKLGRIEDVRADGQWHRAQFDLARAVRTQVHLPENLPFSSLLLGDRHEGYLRAGIGGNPMGASYRIDNFRIVTAADASVPPALLWARLSEPQPRSFRYLADRNPDTQPVHGTEVTQPTSTLQGLGPGFSTFHLQALLPDGRWTSPIHYPLYLQPALKASLKSPADPAAWGGEALCLEFESQEGAHLSLASLAVSIDGAKIAPEHLNATDVAASRRLTLDLTPLPVAFKDGQEILFSASFRSTAGEAPASLSAKLKMNHALDRTPPSAVVLLTYPPLQDFEGKSTGSWQGLTYSRVFLDDATAASGRQSLKVFKPLVIGNFAVNALGNSPQTPLPIHLGKTPVLTFDYRLDPELVIDVSAQAGSGGNYRHIIFAGNGADYPVAGQIPNVVRDGQWRHVEVNLRRMFAGQAFHPTMFLLYGMMFGDFGNQDLGKAHAYHIDNFGFLPQVSSATGLSLRWAATDPSGIHDYSFKWSPVPAEEVDIQPEGTQPEAVFTHLPEGFLYFHIRARDVAGNWGPSSHYKFFIDNQPPAASVVSTGPESRFLELSLKDDDSGVDVSALKAAVQGKASALDNANATYNLNEGRLLWDWPSILEPCAGKLPDGFAYLFQLPGFADFAGNVTPQKEWTWKIDFSRDKEPPVAPSIAGPPNAAFCFQSFTRDVESWRNWGGQNGSTVSRHYDPDRKDYCLKVADDMTSGYGGVMINDRAFDAAQYSWITFEYKIPPNAYIHFMVYVNDVWRGITLTVPSTYPNFTNIGSAGITPDNTWRVAAVDLLQLLKAALPNAKAYTVHHLAIADYYNAYTPAGVPYFIDNFALVGSGPAQPAFTCSSSDPSGIAAYRYLVDNQPASSTEKGTVVQQASFTLPAALQPGLYYVHVSAGDGAGNWSCPAHLPYRTP